MVRMVILRYCFICLAGLLAMCRVGVDFPHDVDIPLTNDIPSSTIRILVDTLVYPESTVATIDISDLNDSLLRVYMVPEGLDPYGVLTAPLVDSVVADLGPKPVRLNFTGCKFGSFKGNYVVCDQQYGRCVIPYHITKTFIDGFSVSPFESRYWRCYNPTDSMHVNLHYPGPTLRFSFPANDTSGMMTAGVVGRFCLVGDFSISIDYKLRDEMLDGFTADFFVSPTQDTSRWSKRCGLFLAGNTNGTSSWITATLGVGVNLTRRDIEVYDGRLCIQRKGDDVTLMCQQLPTSGPDDPKKIVTFDADTVWVHLRMIVKDHARTRHSEWDDFSVTAGEVLFNP